MRVSGSRGLVVGAHHRASLLPGVERFEYPGVNKSAPGGVFDRRQKGFDRRDSLPERQKRFEHAPRVESNFHRHVEESGDAHVAGKLPASPRGAQRRRQLSGTCRAPHELPGDPNSRQTSAAVRARVAHEVSRHVYHRGNASAAVAGDGRARRTLVDEPSPLSFGRADGAEVAQRVHSELSRRRRRVVQRRDDFVVRRAHLQLGAPLKNLTAPGARRASVPASCPVAGVASASLHVAGGKKVVHADHGRGPAQLLSHPAGVGHLRRGGAVIFVVEPFLVHLAEPRLEFLAQTLARLPHGFVEHFVQDFADAEQLRGLQRVAIGKVVGLPHVTRDAQKRHERGGSQGGHGGRKQTSEHIPRRVVLAPTVFRLVGGRIVRREAFGAVERPVGGREPLKHVGVVRAEPRQHRARSERPFSQQKTVFELDLRGSVRGFDQTRGERFPVPGPAAHGAE